MPGRPPEAVLLRRVRTGQGLSIREAARRAGISENRWRQVEAGYQTVRKGVTVPATATAGTLARMAHTLVIHPERLASEGQRPDAAAILDEILRREEDAQVPQATAFLDHDSPLPILDKLDSVADRYLRSVDQDPAPRNDFERSVMTDPSGVPLSQRRYLIAWHRMVTDSAPERDSRVGEAG